MSKSTPTRYHPLQTGLLPIVFGGSGATLPADFYVFAARMLHGVIAPVLALLIVLHIEACLLYTSDAADERSSVDLGGRRIIKKKNK